MNGIWYYTTVTILWQQFNIVVIQSAVCLLCVTKLYSIMDADCIMPVINRASIQSTSLINLGMPSMVTMLTAELWQWVLVFQWEGNLRGENKETEIEPIYVDVRWVQCQHNCMAFVDITWANVALCDNWWTGNCTLPLLLSFACNIPRY